VESILVQTAQPAEIILIDDGSDDDTLIELQRLQQLHGSGWIKIIILDENSGPSVARNIGWSNATQPYLAFLDADDSWHPQKIEIQYGWMLKHPDVALTGHDCQQVDEGKKNCGPKSYFNVDPGFYEVTKRQLLISNRFSTPSVMLRRDILQRYPDSKRYSEDYQLWLEICCAGLKCYRADYSLSFLYKAAYGQSGLSANLWKMEKGELDSYQSVFKQGHIGSVERFLLLVWSLLKFIRRVCKIFLFRKV